MKTSTRHRNLRSAAVTILLLFAAGPAAGEAFSVDSTDDVDDVSPGDGTSADAGGRCTLQAAIQETNALPAPIPSC